MLKNNLFAVIFTIVSLNLFSQDTILNNHVKWQFGALGVSPLSANKLNFGYGFLINYNINPKFKFGFQYLSASNKWNDFTSFDENTPVQEYSVSYKSGINQLIALNTVYTLTNPMKAFQVGWINGVGYQLFETERVVESVADESSDNFFKYDESESEKSFTVQTGIQLSYTKKRSTFLIELPVFFSVAGSKTHEVENVIDYRIIKVHDFSTTSGLNKVFMSSYLNIGYCFSF